MNRIANLDSEARELMAIGAMTVGMKAFDALSTLVATTRGLEARSESHVTKHADELGAAMGATALSLS